MPIVSEESTTEARRLCRQLAVHRIARGLSQRDIAAHFGDRQGNVQRIETYTTHGVTLPTFVSMAWALALEVALVPEHVLPLLDLTADEVMAVQFAASNYADAMPGDSTVPGVPAFVAALRSAMAKLATTEETPDA